MKNGLKNSLAVAVGVLGCTMLPAQPQAIRLDFGNIPLSNISFDGSGHFHFDPGIADQFKITGSDGVGDSIADLGRISGSWIIGSPVLVFPGVWTAPIAGSGTLFIEDGSGGFLLGNLSWGVMETAGTGGTINFDGGLNLTGISYSGFGFSGDLETLSQVGNAEAVVNFHVANRGGATLTLPDLKTNVFSSSFSGTLIADAQVPLVVLNNNDSGPGSLRQAIADGANTITFAPNVTGVITLTSGELAFYKSLAIFGPGAKVLTISGNDASRVFRVGGASSLIANLRIANGHTSGGGGGIAMNGGSLIVSNCAITGCYAQGVDVASAGGGAIAVVGTANLTIMSSTLSSNTTPYQGGGLYLFNAPAVSLVNSTVSGNRTLDGELGDGGGGIYVGNSSTLNVAASTIANNSSAVQGGGIYKGLSGTITVANSLIAGNTAAGLGPDCKGTFVSSGFNLIGNSSGSTGFGAADQLNVSPMIGPLADNGGPTFTHALLADSPAIDQGKSFGAIRDQRSLPRPYDSPAIPNAPGGDGSDVGAFEVQAGSVLRITSVVRSSNDVVLGFTSLAGHAYNVLSTADLASGTWSTLQTGIIGTGGIVQTTISDAFAQSRRFFRIQEVP